MTSEKKDLEADIELLFQEFIEFTRESDKADSFAYREMFGKIFETGKKIGREEVEDQYVGERIIDDKLSRQSLVDELVKEVKRIQKEISDEDGTDYPPIGKIAQSRIDGYKSALLDFIKIIKSTKL